MKKNPAVDPLSLALDFVTLATTDYAGSRLCARHLLFTPSFVLAEQALEKIVKAWLAKLKNEPLRMGHDLDNFARELERESDGAVAFSEGELRLLGELKRAYTGKYPLEAAANYQLDNLQIADEMFLRISLALRFPGFADCAAGVAHAVYQELYHSDSFYLPFEFACIRENNAAWTK